MILSCGIVLIQWKVTVESVTLVEHANDYKKALKYAPVEPKTYALFMWDYPFNEIERKKFKSFLP